MTFLCLLVCLVLASCSPRPEFRYQTDPGVQSLLRQHHPSYPATRYIVLSDMHLYDASLGTEGPAFEAYLSRDRKMLKESQEIIETTVAAIHREVADFVLISGDLTKDGELVSHQLAAHYLAKLEAEGKQVYVVPGNHDVSNGLSESYLGERTERVPNISAADFGEIYGPFGYQEAIHRDPASLSYVAEPVSGLWILALDACRYEENQEDQHVIDGGRLRIATLRWVEDVLLTAVRENKAVLAVMHHAVLEHFDGQRKNMPQYVVADNGMVARLLAAYGVRLVFTGHYHAQDATVARFAENSFLYDIETGSLLTFPVPYRVVQIVESQEMTITSSHVAAIPGHESDLLSYAQETAHRGVATVSRQKIQEYLVNAPEADRLATQVADAHVAHYAGDEVLPPGKEALTRRGLSLPGRLVVMVRGRFIEALWHDLDPPDNQLTIDLNTGAWR